MANQITLSTKDLSLLSDLLTYEQLAATKSQLYSQSIKDPALKDLCKTLEQNHNNNFQALLNLL